MKLLVEKQFLEATGCNQKKHLKPVHADLTSALPAC